MDVLRPKKIAILGGAFDPVHKAHTSLADAVLKAKLADCVFFVPAKISPFKEASFAPDSHRLNMLEIALKPFGDSAKIVDFEICKDGKSYSIDTVKYLKKIYPNTEFFWLIGSDNASKLSCWKDFDELKRLIKFLCFMRPSYPLNMPQGADFQLVDSPAQDISSTRIRSAVLRKDSNFLKFALDNDVLAYILKNNLYQ